MNKVRNDETLPLAVRLALDKIDGIEAAITGSIDRFIHITGSNLSSAIEPSPDEGRATYDKSLPYPENGPVAG
jgi:hypothetical protein